jgi:ATP-dependent Lhr-like helicase
VSVFARFSPRLQEAIVARLGWSRLRPVQEEAGAALLDGMNAVVLAPTAGGKTEAAMFPTLSSLVDDPTEGVGALYVAPIKALLNNQADRLGLYTEMVGLGRFVWHGDTGSQERRRFLKEPAELLMTTPESLEVMLVSKGVDAAALFGELRVVVVDEVHAMAGTDRGAHLMSVLERLAALSRHDVQRIGLSATVGNPEAILAWLQGTSERRAVIVDPPKSPKRKQLLVVHHPDLQSVARDAARVGRSGKSLFFCQTRSVTEAVAEQMRRAGTEVFVHHSAVSREERELAEERFHHGSDACIVCTSTLELGIDVGDLDRVLQAEAPPTVCSFLQRMGRTGRREGQIANTTFFCETSEGVLQAIALIELAKQGWVENVELDPRCWPVMIHQLLAMSLAEDGVTPEKAWTHLERVPDFRGIHRAEYERLVSWMLRDDSLVLTSGRLVLGPKAERRFGRRNFMDLYSVFSSPQSYTVQAGDGHALGSLNQDFVDRLVDGVSCFLLGGRPWVVLAIRHDDRRIVVEAAPRGREPTWGGFLPQFLGHEVCQKIRQVILATGEYRYLSPEAAGVLADRRAALADLLEPERDGLEVVSEELRWWTFAGGRINATLRYALEATNPTWKVIPDNYLLKIRGGGVDRASFDAAVARIAEPEFWEDERFWHEVANSLPAYRLSKFQSLMPPWVERETVAAYLLDLAGASRWLSATFAREQKAPARVPTSTGQPTPGELEVLTSPPVASQVATLLRDASRPFNWISSDPELIEACATLRAQTVVGVDVETTIGSRTLCLVQIAALSGTYLIDALEVSDLGPLKDVLGDAGIVKVIHNAAFERSVLARHDIQINGVVDTLVVSRERHGRKKDGGHSLRAVCEREFGMTVDKGEQTSDWTRRPLNTSQVDYAALDAEVLLRLYEHFGRPSPTDHRRQLSLSLNDEAAT